MKRADSGSRLPSDIAEAFNASMPLRLTKGMGHGLGLDTARELVKKNGGTITVQFERDKGTTFTIRLPIAKESPAGPAAEDDALRNSGPETQETPEALFESLLTEMPEDISIMEGLERIKRCGRFKEIGDFLDGFENLKLLLKNEFNMLPLFVETRAKPEDLDRRAAKILCDEELVPVFSAFNYLPKTTGLLERAVLASEDVRKSLKAFIRKGDGERVFREVAGEFIAAYLAARKTRKATTALLNTVSPDDFARDKRLTLMAPCFGKYYADMDSISYGLLTAIWFYLTPVYEKLRGRGYTFEEAGEALAYLCEHFLDRGFTLPPRNYDYESWLDEREEDIKEHMELGEEQLKTMMDIIKTSPEGIPPAAVFVDKANAAALSMRDICCSMRDEIESLGKKFIGVNDMDVINNPYLAKSPLSQFYRHLLFYAWFSRPWECKTQDDATALLFRLHYYTPLLSEWINRNNEESVTRPLEAHVDISGGERAKFSDILGKIKKGVEELEAIATDMPPLAHEEDVDVNQVIGEILKRCNTELHLDLSDGLLPIKGNRALLKKALIPILRPWPSDLQGVDVRTSVSSGKLCITINAMPVYVEPEILEIILNPSRLYAYTGCFVCPEAQDFSETAAIIEAHGGKI